MMSSKVTKVLPLVALLLVASFVVSFGDELAGFPNWWDQLNPKSKEWAKEAKVGPYATKGINWNEIEEAARKEGKVVVYSQSGRVMEACKLFEEKYPNIKCDGRDLYVSKLMSTWTSEHKAGAYKVDVIYCDSEATMINEKLVPPNKQIWNFVPPIVEKTWADEKYYEPLLIMRSTFQPIFYNPEAYDEPPIDNLWDLTKPRFSEKLLIMDPTTDPFALNWLSTIVSRSGELREAYQKEFGEELELDSGIQNAGFQWLKDLIENDPVTVGSDDEVAEGVGAGEADHLGLAAFYSKYRWTIEGRVNIRPIHDIEPYAGTQTFTYHGISDRAPHPNAAKLFIKAMAGTQEDPVGIFVPWHVPGDFKPRADIGAPEGMPEGKSFVDLESKYIPNDPDFIYNKGLQVRDFWVKNRG